MERDIGTSSTCDVELTANRGRFSTAAAGDVWAARWCVTREWNIQAEPNAPL
jgi:hypothetical protein